MRRTPLLIASAAAAATAVVVIILIATAGGDESAAPTAPTSTTTLPPEAPPETTADLRSAEAEIPSGIAAAVAGWETDWSRRTIDLEELILGIPSVDPRDAIAPLDAPAYETIEEADAWLVDTEPGVLLEIGDTARFHPLRILVAHEIVNDEAGGIPYALTYCPLCNTAAAFDRRVGDQVLRFGVSGLLRKSDLVMWDDATTSLWQQITGEGIVGEFAGTSLEFLATATVTWGDFKQNQPAGTALSRDTGFRYYSYGTNGYVGYTDRPAPYGNFFREDPDDRFPALERVIGVRVGDLTKAYPFSILSEEQVVDDALGGTPITVWWGDTGAADPFASAEPGAGRVIGTGIAFLSTVDGRTLTFSATGDGTFRDGETGSTWTLFGEAVDGPLAGTRLELALHQNEFWFAWAAFNEGSPVHGG
jgi:hypothetical protein